MILASHHRRLILILVLIALISPFLGTTIANSPEESSIQAKLERLIAPQVQPAVSRPAPLFSNSAQQVALFSQRDP